MAFSVKAPKPPRWEDKNLWEMPSDSFSDAGSFEVDEDFIQKEKDLITYEKQMKEAKKQEEDLFSAPKEEGFDDETTKEGDSYSVKKEEPEREEDDLFKASPEEIYGEINDDLKAEDKNMKVISKDSIEVDAMGQKNVITRSDLINYRKSYSLEDGDERPYSQYTKLGNVEGEREQMNNLVSDTSNVFAKIDSRMGGYPTMSDED